MQDPRADVEGALREFVAGALGEENVERGTEVLLAIQTLRPMWPQEYGDSPGDVELARRAHALACDVRIGDGFQPVFPMVLSPRELANELAAQTKVILEFTEFSVAAAAVQEMKRRGAPGAQVEAALAGLPRLEPPSEWMTNLEDSRYLAKLHALKGK